MAPTSPAKTLPYKTLLEYNPNSDFTIRCGDRSFHVNKCMLEVQSPYFYTVCNGGFKEAAEGELVLDEEEPAIVQCILEYIYGRDYDVPGNAWGTDAAPTAKTRKRKKYYANCGPDETCYDCDVEESTDEDDWEFDRGEIATATQQSIEEAIPAQANTSRSKDGESATDKEPKDPAAKMSNSLCHALVYATAEKFQLNDLKAAARRKFKKSLPRDAGNDLENIVAAAFSPEGVGLEDYVVRVCLKQYQVLMRYGGLQDVMEKCGPLAFKMFQDFKSHSDQKSYSDVRALKASHEEVAQLTSEVSKYTKRLTEADRQLKATKARFWKLFALLNTTGYCRKCKTDFPGIFEKGAMSPDDTVPKYVALRCTHCNAKHSR